VLLRDFNLSDETETGTVRQLFFVILSLTSLIGLGLSDLMESEQFPLIIDFINTEKHYSYNKHFVKNKLLPVFCQHCSV